MVRVLVLYPRTGGKKFDLEYYRNRHIPLVKERLKPVKVEIDLGLPNQGQPSPYIAVSHLTFESREQLIENYGSAANELLNDKLRFTDIEIITQISEVIEI
jgi:uncharacterized protein (TIGR02118 family)